MTGEENAVKAEIPKWKYREIESKAVELYIEHKIQNLPINPFDIIKDKGYILVPFSKLEECARPECVNEDNDAFSFYNPQCKTYYIVYNDDKPLRRIRFTLMHEIGHIELGHKCESGLADKMANYYAGYALAPFPLIGKYASDKISDVISVFEVSPDCAEVCWHGYHNWKLYGESRLKDYEIKLLNLF